jgi:hypothetical protein
VLAAAVLGGAAVLAATGLLAGCAAGRGGHGRSAVALRRAPSIAGGGVPAAAPGQFGAGRSGASGGQAQTLALAGQSIIYTASVTARVRDLLTAVTMATRITAAAGGYTASEQLSARPGTSVITSASLELEIPVAGYQAAFAKLAGLGKAVSVSQQARNVTQQVADVTSRVASDQAAIRQLRALLSRAGSVGDLLNVQDQINSEQAALESLLAQQRALAHQTSYAAVSVLLLPQPHKAAVRHFRARHGFVAGLASGWRALRSVTVALLAAIGAALPFAAVLAVLAALLFGAQRRFRARRRGPAPEA